MERRAFGNTGLEVSVLGFGGAEIGYENADQSEVEVLLHSALDEGLNVIDTAECYIDSEEKIGKAVAGRRDDFYLFTKCGHASGFSEADWDPAMLAKQIDRSLERLKTDRVDLVQLHSCSRELLERGEVIDVLKKAKQAGKTRLIGYSGDHEAALYAVECGEFDTLQTSCSIADQECIDLTLPKAAAKGMGVIAKRPIANVAWKKGEDPATYGHVYWKRLQELRYKFLSDAEAVSVALKFTLAQPGICTAIVGTKNPQRWHDNAALLQSGAIPEDQLTEIREVWHREFKPDWIGQN